MNARLTDEEVEALDRSADLVSAFQKSFYYSIWRWAQLFWIPYLFVFSCAAQFVEWEHLRRVALSATILSLIFVTEVVSSLLLLTAARKAFAADKNDLEKRASQRDRI